MMTSSWIDFVVMAMICTYMASSVGAAKCYQCHSSSRNDWCSDTFNPPNPLPEGATCGSDYEACVKITGEENNFPLTLETWIKNRETIKLACYVVFIRAYQQAYARVNTPLETRRVRFFRRTPALSYVPDLLTFCLSPLAGLLDHIISECKGEYFIGT